MIDYFYKGGGFGVQINETENTYQQLASAFESYTKFEGIDIFESENMVAFMRNNRRVFSFHLWTEEENFEVPTIISELAKNRKWSYGDFNLKI